MYWFDKQKTTSGLKSFNEEPELNKILSQRNERNKFLAIDKNYPIQFQTFVSLAHKKNQATILEPLSKAI
jgi:hypothetical protein